jgi:hypothetical protein
VLVLAKHLQPYGEPQESPLYLAPTCPIKVSLGSKCLTGMNAGAYFSRLFSDKTVGKSFASLASARRRCLQGNARFPAGADKNVQVKFSTLKENLVDQSTVVVHCYICFNQTLCLAKCLSTK